MKTAAKRIGNYFITYKKNTFSKAVPSCTYTLSSFILMFFTFSGIGWLWEVAIHIIQDGKIVNRGIMSGPWLPIYGTGALLILVLLRRWHRYPLSLFCSIVLTCGVMEYATSMALEKTFGVKWWDYSDMAIQIHGRVCLSGLLIFGVGGLLIVYLAAPALNRLFLRIPVMARLLLCGIFVSLFVLDILYSFKHPNMGAGITTLIP